MDPVREIFDSKKGEELENHIKLTRISSVEAGVRTEATSMAVISDMGSERKPWTTGRPYWTTLGRRVGTGSWGGGSKGEE